MESLLFTQVTIFELSTESKHVLISVNDIDNNSCILKYIKMPK